MLFSHTIVNYIVCKLRFYVSKFYRCNLFKIDSPLNIFLSYYSLPILGTFLVAQMVKHLSTMQETQVRSLGQEDLLEKEMATHSSTLAWENSMDAGAWWATVHGVPKSQTRLSDFNVNVPILKKFRYFL